MATRTDMTGMKYGRLTVICYDHTDKYKKAHWKCLCECGNEVVVLGSGLRRGTTKSCRYLSKEITSQSFRKNNEVGNKYGRLTIIGFSHIYCPPNKPQQKRSMWLCKCECGNETVVSINSLHRGNTRSCGCLHRETVRSIAGAKHCMWNPNITDEEREQRKEHRQGDRDFKQWSLAIKKIDNYICQKCKNRGGRLESHHMLPWKTHPERRYDLSNGVTLCKKCHKEFHKIYGLTPAGGILLTLRFLQDRGER